MITFLPTPVSKESTLPDYVQFTARFIFFAIVHSLFATSCAKKIAARFFGREPRFYRLGYNLASMIMFLWVMAAYRSSPVIYFATGIWSLVMYAAQIVVAGIIFLCVRQTGTGDFLGTSHLRAPKTQTQPYHLVTSGCYAHMRHPLYFYSTIFLVLNPVMTVQWLLLTIFSLIYFIIGALIEERRLLIYYGEEYRLYQQRVAFMIPAFKKNKLLQ